MYFLYGLYKWVVATVKMKCGKIWEEHNDVFVGIDTTLPLRALYIY